MLELQCTVRKCCNPLLRLENGLGCAAGHHFDQAKEGYWNLTQPQDKKSLNPGDNKDAVHARHRWLQRGHGNGLVGSLQDWIGDQFSSARILDLGCGDGSFAPLLFPDDADGFCGIDLSKPAIKLAARGWPQATWVLANADRGLPVMNATVDLVISLFGRRPVAEIKRVLKRSGVCMVAVPAEDDLLELREVVQKRGERRSRVEAIIQEMEDHGLKCLRQKQWRSKVEIGSDEIEDALAMTYRARRWSEKKLISSMDRKQVTLAADLMMFVVG
ncbi:MAG: methyltransferase domain-containing protein [Rubripirellula sp.]